MSGIKTDPAPPRGVPYIRFFVSTDGPTSGAALSYLKSMLRIAPVRLVPLSGDMTGPWDPMRPLMMTPMDEPMIANVVCTHPDLWVRIVTVGIPKTETSPAEKASRAIELHTEGEHNVLIAMSVPRSKVQFVAAGRYDAIIASTTGVAMALMDGMVNHAGIGKNVVHIATTPTTDHAAVRKITTKS